MSNASDLPINEDINLSLNSELSHRDEFLIFLKANLDKGDSEYKFEQFSSKCIPDGAEHVRIDIVGEVIYLDYRNKNARYIIGYRLDGTVEKTVRADNSNLIYYVDSNNLQPDVLKLNGWISNRQKKYQRICSVATCIPATHNYALQ